MPQIYNYFDQNGISFKKLIINSINAQEDDILTRIQLESDETTKRIIKKGDLILSTHNHMNVKIPSLPSRFNLDIKEQEEIVINWVKDTTGYIVTEFKTLFELPELNENPFLLQVERGVANYFLVLATSIVDGDLIIREKYNKNNGFLQENFIRTFGQITRINGNLGIDGKMNNFGQLSVVDGDLWFSNHVYQEYLESVYPLKKVVGNLNLKNTHACLSSLEEVGGNLNLRKTTCYDLSSLVKVGGNILLSKSQSHNYDFSKTEIAGTIKMFNDEFSQRKLTSR